MSRKPSIPKKRTTDPMKSNKHKETKSSNSRNKTGRIFGFDLSEKIDFDNSEQKSDDAQFDEFGFLFRSTESKGIPWREYSELEIQMLLKMHFEILDYDVVWRHKDDPAHEMGIDLECTRQIDRRKVVIQVKINPKKDDLGQILELTDSQADQRLYVYTGKAAQSFRDQTRKFKDSVKFLDSKGLERLFSESEMLLRLEVDNSMANKAIVNIMKSFINFLPRGMTRTEKRKGFKENVDDFECLWNLKDRAVTVYKCLGFAQLMFEVPSRFGKLSSVQVNNLVIYVLDYVYTHSLKSLENTFGTFSDNMKALLHDTYIETYGRSNWLELTKFLIGLIPGNVTREFEQYSKVNERDKDSLKEFLAESKSEYEKYRLSEIERAADWFRILSIWAHGMETTIDDMYGILTRQMFKQ